MKPAEEYLKNVTALTTREKLYEIGKQIQIDAYNEALEDAANENNHRDSFYESNTWWVPKDSILKLKK